MDVVAQWIRTSWTKRSRGGQEASRRAATPVAFTLPETGSPLSHEITLSEWALFTPRWVLREAAPDDVDLAEEGDLLRVHLKPAPIGIPPRRRSPAVRLRRGQWLRWRINYHVPGSCYTDWSYQEDTLNLAYGRVSATVFHGTPTRTVDERTRLR